MSATRDLVVCGTGRDRGGRWGQKALMLLEGGDVLDELVRRDRAISKSRLNGVARARGSAVMRAVIIIDESEERRMGDERGRTNRLPLGSDNVNPGRIAPLLRFSRNFMMVVACSSVRVYFFHQLIAL